LKFIYAVLNRVKVSAYLAKIREVERFVTCCLLHVKSISVTKLLGDSMGTRKDRLWREESSNYSLPKM